MAKILHICNNIDPAGTVTRCARLMHHYSIHQHRVWVRIKHPESYYGFEHPPNVGDEGTRAELLNWCDGIIYHLVGHQGFPDAPNKPAAFRNVNVQYDLASGSFYTASSCIPTSYSRYKLTAMAHPVAKGALPAKSRWLPDMVPLDGIYTPDYSERPPCVTYNKYGDYFDLMDFPPAFRKLRISALSHSDALRVRRV